MNKYDSHKPIDVPLGTKIGSEIIWSNQRGKIATRDTQDKFTILRNLSRANCEASARIKIFGIPDSQHPVSGVQVEKYRSAIDLLMYAEAIEVFDYDFHEQEETRDTEARQYRIALSTAKGAKRYQLIDDWTKRKQALDNEVKAAQTIRDSSLDLFMYEFLLTPGAMEKLQEAVVMLQESDQTIATHIAEVIDRCTTRMSDRKNPPAAEVVAFKASTYGLIVPLEEFDANKPLAAIIRVASQKPAEVYAPSTDLGGAMIGFAQGTLEHYWRNADRIYPDSHAPHLSVIHDLFAAALVNDSHDLELFYQVATWIGDRTPKLKDQIVAEYDAVVAAFLVETKILNDLARTVLPYDAIINLPKEEFKKKLRLYSLSGLLDGYIGTFDNYALYQMMVFLSEENDRLKRIFAPLTKNITPDKASMSISVKKFVTNLNENMIILSEEVLRVHSVPTLIDQYKRADPVDDLVQAIMQQRPNEVRQIYAETRDGSLRAILAGMQNERVGYSHDRAISQFTQADLLYSLITPKLLTTNAEAKILIDQNEPLMETVTRRYKYFVAHCGDSFDALKNPFLDEYFISSLTYFPVFGRSGSYYVVVNANTDTYQLGYVRLLIAPGQPIRLAEFPIHRLERSVEIPLANLVLPPLEYIVSGRFAKEKGQGLGEAATAYSGPRERNRVRSHWMVLTGSQYTLLSTSAGIHADEVYDEYGIDVFDETRNRRIIGELAQDQMVTFYRGYATKGAVPYQHILVAGKYSQVTE